MSLSGDQGAPAITGARVTASIIVTSTQLTVTQHWGKQTTLSPPVHSHCHVLELGVNIRCHNSMGDHGVTNSIMCSLILTPSRRCLG